MATSERRLISYHSILRAGDLVVIVRKSDRKRVVAVAQVHGERLQYQSDHNILLKNLQPERHTAIRHLLAHAPTFNIVFFDKVYDCRGPGNLTLPLLVSKVPGLQEPRSLHGPGILTTSKEVLDAMLGFLNRAGYPSRLRR